MQFGPTIKPECGIGQVECIIQQVSSIQPGGQKVKLLELIKCLVRSRAYVTHAAQLLWHFSRVRASQLYHQRQLSSLVAH